MRISTSFLNNSLVNNMQASNANLSKFSAQITSGNKTNDLSEIASQAGQLLSLKDVSKQSQVFIGNMQAATSRLQATEQSLNNLNDLMVQAASLYTQANNENSAETRATLAPTAEQLLESFYSITQTKFDGRYLFSGQDSSKSPLSGTPTATSFPGNPVPTTYYQGDSAKTSTITGPGTVETYGVLASNSGFANMKAGLEALWYGLENNSTTDIEAAISTLETAQVEISNMVGEVGGQTANFKGKIERLEANDTFLKERIDEIEKVDVTEAMTMFTQEQATLQASMAVLTRISSLSLLDFLR